MRKRSTIIHSSEEKTEHFGVEITTTMTLSKLPFPDMEGPNYLIEYLNKNDEKTEREIIIQWINESNSDFLVTAYCKLRKKVRTFNSQRIASMTDASTGKRVIDVPSHLKLLAKNT